MGEIKKDKWRLRLRRLFYDVEIDRWNVVAPLAEKYSKTKMILTNKRNNMKVLFLLILNSCMLNRGAQETFLDKVTKDFGRYSYYICLKSMNGENYIIENDDFFYYLQNQTGINEEQYQKDVRAKLNDGKTFEIINPDSNFIKVPNVPRVEANANKGVDEFIKIYFDNVKTLKDDVTDDEKTVVIQRLFEWKIASKIDDETGSLVISQ